MSDIIMLKFNSFAERAKKAFTTPDDYDDFLSNFNPKPDAIAEGHAAEILKKYVSDEETVQDIIDTTTQELMPTDDSGSPEVTKATSLADFPMEKIVAYLANHPDAINLSQKNILQSVATNVEPDFKFVSEFTNTIETTAIQNYIKYASDDSGYIRIDSHTADEALTAINDEIEMSNSIRGIKSAKNSKYVQPIRTLSPYAVAMLIAASGKVAMMVAPDGKLSDLAVYHDDPKDDLYGLWQNAASKEDLKPIRTMIRTLNHSIRNSTDMNSIIDTLHDVCPKREYTMDKMNWLVPCRTVFSTIRLKSLLSGRTYLRTGRLRTSSL